MSSSSAPRIEGLKEAAKEFPQSPGVYLMKGGDQKILYVGKAKSLRQRVRSYFQDSRDMSPKTRLLVSHIHSVEYILTKTEVEAFLLEASLIKKHRPRYNIRLKDDKSYPYIRVSLTDPFPRLYLARRVAKDGSVYFGPYTSGGAVWGTIRFLNQTFRIRDCRDAFFASRKRPCMTYQIGRCTAPCTGLIDQMAYQVDVQAALSFLRGRDDRTLQDLERRMAAASDSERYEEAARLRDSVSAIRRVLERQAVINDTSDIDQDVMGFVSGPEGTMIVALHLRRGRVIGTRHHFLAHLDASSPGEDVREWFVSFLNQYYEDELIPDELIVPVEIGNDMIQLLRKVFEARSGRDVGIRYPTDEVSQRLVDIALKNADQRRRDHLTKAAESDLALEEIQRKLGLKQKPKRIECFDISTFQGQQSVASKVVVEDGLARSDLYRRYRIKTVSGVDDFASMREVLSRRLKRVTDAPPDLIVVDGGRGQLGVAFQVLQELGFEDKVGLVGLAKARTKGEFSDQEVEATEERFFIPGRTNPVTFTPGSRAFQILVGLRDEAHRFAISYHRLLRDQKALDSRLSSIKGMGPKRTKELLTTFGSTAEFLATPREVASERLGWPEELIERVFEALRPE
jgi:excinuclease ABC subunit C